MTFRAMGVVWGKAATWAELGRIWGDGDVRCHCPWLPRKAKGGAEFRGDVLLVLLAAEQGNCRV